ncbi:MAG: Mur ligase family protein [Candidatus Melainabacteria bacterium]|nr:Mur ligase family protein [Candidatus Melainabacteria bacterium]
MNYSEAIAYIQSFPDMERATYGARGPTMGLPSMRTLLERMGNPQLGRHTIHVAGSKGKGSTSTMIARILDEAGLSTALYTSPHLHDYNERISFGSKLVDADRFARGVSEIKPIIEAERLAGNTNISTFGVLTALFFQLVQSSTPPVDWQVVEVGLGGRYDVTNVFATKDVAIITPISLEHVEILGATPTEIAVNKAGIITPKCIAVLAPQKDQGARTAVGRRCGEVQAQLVDVAREYKIRAEKQDLSGQTFQLESKELGALELFTPMLGNHQVFNASTAAAAALALKASGVAITHEHIRKGLEKAIIPGRFQILTGVKDGKKNGEQIVVVDAAHNHESAQALADAIKTIFEVKKCIFVLGLNTDKNISAIWKQLESMSKLCIATRSQNPRSMNPDDIAEVITTFGASDSDVRVAPNVPEAIEEARKLASEGDIIVITGSIYVVGEAREHILKDKAGNVASSR